MKEEYIKKELNKEKVIDVETGLFTEIWKLESIIAAYEIKNNKFVVTDTFYSSMPYKYPNILVDNKFMSLSLSLIKDENLIEDLKYGVFYHSAFADNFYKVASNYFEGTKKYRTFENSYPKLPEKTNNFILTGNKRYTFGVELETASGYIPEYLDFQLNMSCEYDGSLRPEGGGEPISGEYVTGVLTGNNGLLMLQKICNELSKRCTVDKKCGVHIHLGNIEFNQSFIVYAYKLALAIQEELFDYLPPSRRNSVYCQFLPNLRAPRYLGKTANKVEYDLWLSDIYNEIVKKTAKYDPSEKINKKTQHPRGAKVGYDHSNIRYCWLNFIPCLFNTRENESYTLEFRPHSGTLNFTKVKNWLMLCIAFVNFVENYQKDIENEYYDSNGQIQKITIPLLLELCYGNNERTSKLINYFEKRKELFTGENAHKEEEKEYSKPKLNSIKQLTIKELLCV